MAIALRAVLFAAIATVAIATPPASAQATGSISGTVTFATPPPFPGMGGTKRVGVYTATAAVGDSRLVTIATLCCGDSYVVDGLAPGTYYVRTVSDGFSIYADEWYPSLFVATPGGRPIGVTVTAGHTTSGINFSLSAFTGAATGTLTLAALPFRGQVHLPSVDIYNDDNLLVRTAQLTPTPGATAGSPLTADPPAGGTWTWRAAGLPSGRYYAKTSNPASPAPNNGHVAPSGGWWVDELFDNRACVVADCLPNTGTPLSVTGGSSGGGLVSPSSVDIALDYGAVISGALPSPTFVGTIGVDIYDSRGVPMPQRATVDAITFGTSYFANGLPAGTYFLKMRRDTFGKVPETLYKDQPCSGCAVTSGTPVTVSPGESRTGIDFVALPSRSIRGTVRTGGSGLAQVTVDVFTPNGARLGTTTTASDGTYALDGLLPGSYYLRTVNTAGYVDVVYDNLVCPGCDPLRGTAVTVGSSADTSGVDFSLAQGVAVSGLVQSVFVSSNSATPIRGVGVSLYIPQGPAGTIVGRAVSDATGRFTVVMPPGTYYALTDAEPGYMRRLYVNGNCAGGICDFNSGTPIVVGGSAITNVDLPLAQCTAPPISPVTLARAALGGPYRQTLATSAPPPSLYSVSAGALPPGVTLNPVFGVISGTPAAAGNYSFTISVEVNGCVGSRTYTLDVPACVLHVSGAPASRATGEPFLVPVTTNCASWSVSSNASWISIQHVPPTDPTHVLITTAPYSGTTPRTGTVTVGSRVVTVYQNGVAPQPPFGVLEIPVNGEVIAGSVAVSGWALDDLAIQRVAIYRDPVAGEGSGQIFLGDATIVEGARPDVEAAFPTAPGNKRAGYGYLLLTNMLPNGGNGTFNLHAYADDIDNNRVLLGSRTVIVVNGTATAPFGAIDTPDQGAIVSGQSYVNFGWALTPQPKLIPFDGSTISVVIDGVPVGKVNGYNFARSDVSGLFPGLKNSAGPVGFRVIDTTALSEGLHTLAWVVTDDAGQSTGIGSRYFTVQNSAWTPSQRLASRVVPPAFMSSEVTYADATTAVPPRIDGVDVDRKVASLADLPVVATRARTIALKPQQRLELSLAPAAFDTELRRARPAVCASSYDGYLAANGELRALPVGSSLDRSGTFYWQPGPAFSGTYQLLFVSTSCDGIRTRIPVTVSIR